MNGYYQQVAKLLTAAGFAYVRPGKGSHEIWSRGRLTLIVPFNCYSRHTANAIMRDAGIRHKF
jgi:predicted RNA binding protein YcfA (HicA-like mRNA interferase family)